MVNFIGFYIFENKNLKTTTLLYLVFLLLLTSSCATVLGSKNQKINIYSNDPKAQLLLQDTVVHLPYTLVVKRSKKELPLRFIVNGQEQDTILKAKANALFLAGNIPTLPLFGIGYGVDFTNPKRFRYRKNIFLNATPAQPLYIQEAEEYINRKQLKDSAQVAQVYTRKEKAHQEALSHASAHQEWLYKRFHPTKGTTYFTLITPSLYSIGFSNKNNDVKRFHSSLGGISFGVALDYFYKDHRFFTLEIGHKSNMFDPIFWLYDDFKDQLTLALMDGYRWKRWQVSYGLAFSATRYDYYQSYAYSYEIPEENPQTTYRSDPGDNRRTYSTSYQSLGFSGLVHYQLTPRLFVGMSYKPTFYTIRKNNAGFDYEHTLGLDFRIKF